MELSSNLVRELAVTPCTFTSRVDIESEDHTRWVSKAFLDILREHIIPNLGRFCASCLAADTRFSVGQAEVSVLGHPWPGIPEKQADGRERPSGLLRESQAAIALVCSDWAAAQRQAEQDAVQVRLCDGGQVHSLASYLRRRARVAALRLQSPQPDVTDAPGMVAAIGDLLYGSPFGGNADGDTEGVVRLHPGLSGEAVASRMGAGGVAEPGLRGGGGGGGIDGGIGGGIGDFLVAVPVGCGTGRDAGSTSGFGAAGSSPGASPPAGGGPDGGGSGAGKECAGGALPSSLRSLEADGPTAVPLLLLAAAELPYLEALSLSQLPAAWTYEEGALPWPPQAEARLQELLPPKLRGQVADSELYTLMYGAAVNRRFKSYWSSYDGALAALLLLRGHQLRELSLEAPARSVGLRVLELLTARGPGSCRLETLRLRAFGLRREPHQVPRVPLERSGLRLEAGLRALAAAAAPPPPMTTTEGARHQHQHLYFSHTPQPHQTRHGHECHRQQSQLKDLDEQQQQQQKQHPAIPREARAVAAAVGTTGYDDCQRQQPLTELQGSAGGGGGSGGIDESSPNLFDEPGEGIREGTVPAGGGSGACSAGDTAGPGRRPAHGFEADSKTTCARIINGGGGRGADDRVGAGGSWGALPSALPSLPGPYGGGEGCHFLTHTAFLTRLELLACGAEPLDAAVLEGLTGLRALSLRDSFLTWRDRPPDLRALRQLRSLNLRRSNWLAPRGTPWDEPLLLPASLEALDLIGFSSLTSADLGSLERLTALAELSDITLEPDPADLAGHQPLQPPYASLAAVTCMHAVRLYVGRGGSSGCGNDRNRWRSDEEDEDEEDDGSSSSAESTSGSSSRGGRRGGGGGGGGRRYSSRSSTDGSVRHEDSGAAARRRRRRRRQVAQRRRANRGLGSSNGGRGVGSGSRGGSAGGADSQRLDRRICRVAGDESGPGSSGGGSAGSALSLGRRGGSVAAATSTAAAAPPPPAPPAAVLDAPLVSLTLYGMLPQYISDLFPALPLLTRLVFGGEEKERLGEDSDEDGENAGVGQLALRVGDLPRLRELELSVGLLGYGQLALGAATSLTKLVVDDVEYVDVRYIELPSSLQHLFLSAWFGLPELYHLAEGPLLSTAMARAAAGRMDRAARAGGGGGDSHGGSSSGDDRSSSGEWPLGATGGGAALMGLQEQQDVAPQDLTRVLEAEVERQLVQRLLPPLRQLRVLQLNWDVVTHGPLMTNGGGTSSSVGTASRWPFPCLPLLEELSIPWMQELPDEDLARLLASCPTLRGVSHGNGSRRAVRGPEGSWMRRSVGAT